MPGSSLPLWIGLGVAVLVGILFSLLHAFASINLNADQVISGTAINMIAGALTVFLARNMTGSGNIRIMQGFIPKDVPVLSSNTNNRRFILFKNLCNYMVSYFNTCYKYILII